MCGIYGVTGRGSAAVPDPYEMAARAALMHHRGPDDSGVWASADGLTALAHCRLSILDLTAAGRQPMSDPTGRLTIAYNGEIYNHAALRDDLARRGYAFSTRTDTEVVLAAYAEWGSSCVDRFVGMFAFALVDRDRQSVFCARDRAGEKPFFYWHTSTHFAFASELKALAADPSFPRRIDVQALDSYLAYGYVPREQCIYEGVRKLPPGHALEYSIATHDVRVWRYWHLPSFEAAGDAGDGQLLNELEDLLTEAVRVQLVADVPVGILLSGGVDSSIVAALAARVSSQPVRAFTVSFPGAGRFDEAAYARIVAGAIGADHVVIDAGPADVDLLPRLARQYDEPLADSSMIPTFLVAQMIRTRATVALGGDGGDELFGGYPHYSWVQRQERIRRLLPRPVRQLGSLVAQRLPPGVRGRNHLIGGSDGPARSVAHINLYFDARLRAALLRPLGVRAAVEAEAARAATLETGSSPFRMAYTLDFDTYMADDILVKVDRASMLASLEVRAPFLDYRVIEFAFGRVPDRLKATRHERKVLLRRLAARLLPPELDLTRKQGFSLPLGQWLRRGPWRTMVEDVLRSAPQVLFDQRTISMLLRQHDRGFDNAQRLFALTMFELWRRTYEAEVIREV